MKTPATGLTHAEAAARAAEGRANRVRRAAAWDYLEIVRRNVLTLFNALVVPCAVVLLSLGDYKAGLAVCGMAVANTVLGLVQELRAKRQLDALTLLAEGRVQVRREGQVVEIPAGDVVESDVLLLKAGDSIVADGEVIESRYLEIDEALLTGESDPVQRKAGDALLSGSFCVAGEGVYVAQRVGAEAFAQKTATEARSYRYAASPIQAQIDPLVNYLTMLAVLMAFAYLVLYATRGGFDDRELARRVAATITSMVPQGLVLMVTLALLLGALRMTGRGALVNRLAAVEAMASIDTLCMDKTGTLTTNHLHLVSVTCLDAGREDEVRRLLALFACCSLDRDSKSLQAVRHALGDAAGELVDQLPFKSQNRYSGVRVRAGSEYVLVLGAPEALHPLLTDPLTTSPTAGLRQLLFTEATTIPRPTFGGSLDGFRLRPLAVVALGDELRPEAADVLRQLADQGIRFKILSGDNAATVAATVAPLGLDPGPVVAGSDLEAAADPADLIATRSVFGRVSPWQKVEVVRTLTATGHNVAMIGDGVNDVLPIKHATLGIAMGDGSRASKTVAGVVLRTNDFGLLPSLLDEGRIIVRNLRRSAKLFLTKNVYTFLLVVAALGIFNLPFPFAPQQVTLLNFLTIGFPALLITLDRRPAEVARGDFLREVGWFAGTTGVVLACATLAAWLASARYFGDDHAAQRTMVLTTLVLLGWATLWRTLRGGNDRLLNWYPLAGTLLYLMAMYVPPVAGFFELTGLDLPRWGVVIGMTALGGVTLMALDRSRSA